ncbi:MAG: T9SS type A sorting domain-containing protein [Bacteroidales bacterium]|nr:T9SS type A sorting domain-containing protein [Bacteroidales bacterium]
MKKIIVSLLIVLIPFVSFSQSREVIFQESFDEGTVLPAGWIKMGVSLFNWTVVNSAHAGGAPNEVHLAWEPEFDGIVRLVSPSINLTGVSEIGIQFSHTLYFWDEGITLGIATSSDNGATWHVGWSREYTESIDAEVVSESIATEDVGSANFRFCLFVDGKSFNFDDWWFDDFSVFNMVGFDASLTKIDVDYYQVAGNQEVACVIENVGSNNITSLELNYQFDDGDVVTELFEMDLAPFEDQSFTFQEQTILPEGLYELKIWISQVNGGNDGSISNNSLSKMVNVVLGKADRNPMIELFSASTCAPCVGVNQEVLALLAQNPNRYAISKYQMNWPGTGDPYYTAEGGVRRSYYGVNGVPSAFIDGIDFYPYTQEVFDDAADEDAIVDIRGTFNLNGQNIHASVDVMAFSTLMDATLYIIVNEKTTTGNVGTNGETEFHHVMMKFLPNAQGTIINLTPGEHQFVEYDANLAGTHIEDFSDLEVAAFVQDNASKYVYNSHFLYEYNDVHPFAPASLSLTDNGNNTLTATWTAPEGSNPTGYQLFINEELVLNNTDQTTYTTNSPNGLYVVEVLANYPDNQTSVKVAKSIMVVQGNAVQETKNDVVRLFPNPASDVVYIKGVEVETVAVYDSFGRKTAVLDHKTEINVASYPSGVYFMVITATDGTQSVKKLLVLPK